MLYLIKKNSPELDGVSTPVSLALWRQRQENFDKLETSLVCIVEFKPGLSMELKKTE